MNAPQSFLDGKVVLHAGDCLDVIKSLADNSIDSCVTDPPYFLTSITKRFGAKDAAPAQIGKDGRFQRLGAGFMSKLWDAPEAPPIDPNFANWFAGFVDGEGCFSVHKKNVNGYPQTYDCQFSITLRADDGPIIVDIQRNLGGIGSVATRSAPGGNAKAQVRYCVSSKADCQRLRAILAVFPLRAKKARDFEIWSHALDAWIEHEPKGSWENVAYFRDALMAVRNFGSVHRPERLFFYRVGIELLRVLKPGAHIVSFGGTRTYHHMVCGLEDAGFEIRDMIGFLHGVGFPKSKNIGEGWGTALKPAVEPICLARKPLSEPTVAKNVLRWGTGAINIDGCRVDATDKTPAPVGQYGSAAIGATGHKGLRDGSQDSLGRWPANIVHDGSPEVLAAFPNSESSRSEITSKPSAVYGNGAGLPAHTGIYGFDDSGSAARFFYSAKADADDRLGSKHPTVKPVDLMQWLCRLITPAGGVVLDPFAGTGTTAAAAYLEGFRAVLIEREAEYQADIARRMALMLCGPDERARESIKARGLTADAGPLFEARA